MNSLDLRFDMGFLLHGASHEDQVAFLEAIRSNVIEKGIGPVFETDAEFENALGAGNASYISVTNPQGQSGGSRINPCLLQARRIFTDVQNIIPTIDGDEFYDIRDQTLTNGKLKHSADVYVNYFDDAPNPSYGDRFSMESMYEYLSHSTKPITYEKFIQPFLESKNLKYLDSEGLSNIKIKPADSSILVYLMESQIYTKLKDAIVIANFIAKLKIGSDDLNSVYDCLSHLTHLSVSAQAEILTQMKSLVETKKTNWATVSKMLAATKGLLASDIISTIKASFASENVETCTDKITKYQKSKEYEKHKEFASYYLTKNPELLDDISMNLTEATEMIMHFIMVESQGNEHAQNGSFCGLMQVSPDVFAQYRDPKYPNDPFDYRANLASGIKYLAWCYRDCVNKFNSPAIGITNYNMGCQGTKDYRHGKRDLNTDTKTVYIPYYLICLRVC